MKKTSTKPKNETLSFLPNAEAEPVDRVDGRRDMGILPSRAIRHMVQAQQIWAPGGVQDDQIQPASLDVRLGETAYRLRASFLPGQGGQVMEKLAELAYHKIDLTQGAVLETGCVYLIPLMEVLALPERSAAIANPKSSTGRIDVFTRLVTDFGMGFDMVAAGYKGHLYLEVSPRTFPIVVRTGSRLAQIRFRRGMKSISDGELRRLHDDIGLVDGHADIDGGLALSVDLKGKAGAPIGWRAKRHAGLIDVDRSDYLPLAQYWEPILPDANAHALGRLILDPDEFYILASREAVTIPPTHAAEMMPFNPLVGEFRVHYAGFFDPGFGADEAGGTGSRAVLEVRSRDVPFTLEHGQIIGRIVYERLTDEADALYGQALGSNYQQQGLRLSKHFKQ